MARDASGNYVLPPGNPVVTETVVSSTTHNTTMEDVAAAMTDSLSRTGKGGMLAPFKVTDGTPAEPGLAFQADVNTGIHRPANDTLDIVTNGLTRARFKAGLNLVFGSTSTSDQPVNEDVGMEYRTHGDVPLVQEAIPSGSRVMRWFNRIRQGGFLFRAVNDTGLERDVLGLTYNGLDAKALRVGNAANPVDPQDLATRAWVEGLVSGIGFQAVAVTFTATAGQTEVVLTDPPANVNTLDVSVNGFTLINGVDFTLSGGTVTFALALEADEQVLIRYVKTQTPTGDSALVMTPAVVTKIMDFITSGGPAYEVVSHGPFHFGIKTNGSTHQRLNAPAMEFESRSLRIEDDSVGLGFYINALEQRNFSIELAVWEGYPGRIYAQLVDNTTGAIITDPSLSLGYLTGPWDTWSADYGGAYTVNSDSLYTVAFTVVRPNTRVRIIITGGTEALRLRGYAVKSFNTADRAAPPPITIGTTGIPPRGATQNPGAAGTIGGYLQGDFITNLNAAIGQPMGWVCTAPGNLLKPWTPSTFFQVGQRRNNDGGKTYNCVQEGTSAASGGPTGTGPGNITDGTCAWVYSGTRPVFAATPNLV